MDICLEKLENKNCFSKEDLIETADSNGMILRVKTLEKYLSKLMNDGEIARVGRNEYCIRGDLQEYSYQYSDKSAHIADILESEFYDLDFRIMEISQLNSFVNHMITHNVIFVYVEKDLCPSAFENLKKNYEGHILINPRKDDFFNYRSDDMIVVRNLISESPKGSSVIWHTDLEKLLVDILSENLIKSTIAESEYPLIYETAFQNYVIDESKMFRYASRRKSADKIRKFIEEETNVELRTMKRGAGYDK